MLHKNINSLVTKVFKLSHDTLNLSVGTALANYSSRATSLRKLQIMQTIDYQLLFMRGGNRYTSAHQRYDACQGHG